MSVPELEKKELPKVPAKPGVRKPTQAPEPEPEGAQAGIAYEEMPIDLGDNWGYGDADQAFSAQALSRPQLRMPPKVKSKAEEEKAIPTPGEISPFQAAMATSRLEDRVSQIDVDHITTFDILICFFCGTIGAIIGIVRLVQGRMSGAWMLLMSFLFGSLWGVFVTLLFTAWKEWDR
ncbi:MAG: hypothetical protein KDA96_05865 [Planctomycetaceae bacterium]|nr:hypothetical protein [Planctomycetaceae bacterium]